MEATKSLVNKNSISVREEKLRGAIGEYHTTVVVLMEMYIIFN